jgi:hypothetical protein
MASSNCGETRTEGENRAQIDHLQSKGLYSSIPPFYIIYIISHSILVKQGFSGIQHLPSHRHHK